MLLSGPNLFDMSARDILLNRKDYNLGDVYPELTKEEEVVDMEGDKTIIVGGNKNKHKGLSDRVSIIDKEEETIEDINKEIEDKLKMVIDSFEKPKASPEDLVVDNLLLLGSRFLESLDVDVLNRINENIKISVSELGSEKALEAFISPERENNMMDDIMLAALRLTEEVREYAIKYSKESDMTFAGLLEKVIDLEKTDPKYMMNHFTVEEIFNCDGESYKWGDLVPHYIVERELKMD